MNMEDKEFRTLRGFLNGEEEEEESYFEYSATLRIFGDIPDLNEITNRLGFEPTDFHLKGNKIGASSPPFKHDMWSYSVPLPENQPLENHIDALWNKIKHNKEYLLELKANHSVDVFLGYRSNHDHAGIEVPYTSLEMFTELEIPFGLSIIIA